MKFSCSQSIKVSDGVVLEILSTIMALFTKTRGWYKRSVCDLQKFHHTSQSNHFVSHIISMNDWKEKIKQRLLSFLDELNKECLKCGRRRDEVKVIYATKYLTPEQFVIFLRILKELVFESDLKDVKSLTPFIIGENRVQDAKEKIDLVRETDPKLLNCFSLVMIGTLQTNKINKALEFFQEIHSVDSLELAQGLDKRVTRDKREKEELGIFLEVNLSEEESKHGFSLKEIDGVIKKLKSLKYLQLKGLMTMAPYAGDPDEVRPIFKRLRQLADRYQLKTSMGMSNDWKVAVEEGTDMIRIGGKLYGL